MFTNLANYLLGSIANQDQGATTAGVENSSRRLTAVEQEDDWVLVDEGSDCDSDKLSDHLSVHSLEDDDECHVSDCEEQAAGEITR